MRLNLSRCKSQIASNEVLYFVFHEGVDDESESGGSRMCYPAELDDVGVCEAREEFLLQRQVTFILEREEGYKCMDR